MLVPPPLSSAGSAAPRETDTSGDDATLAAVFALRGLILAGEQFRHAIADHFGVGLSEMLALSYLSVSGPTNPRQLATHLGLTPSTITALLDRLAEADLAVRRPHPTDRRKTVVVVSDGGDRVVREVRSLLAATVARFDQARLPDTAEVLETVAQALTAQVDAARGQAAG